MATRKMRGSGAGFDFGAAARWRPDGAPAVMTITREDAAPVTIAGSVYNERAGVSKARTLIGGKRRQARELTTAAVKAEDKRFSALMAAVSLPVRKSQHGRGTAAQRTRAAALAHVLRNAGGERQTASVLERARIGKRTASKSELAYAAASRKRGRQAARQAIAAALAGEDAPRSWATASGVTGKTFSSADVVSEPAGRHVHDGCGGHVRVQAPGAPTCDVDGANVAAADVIHPDGCECRKQHDVTAGVHVVVIDPSQPLKDEAAALVRKAAAAASVNPAADIATAVNAATGKAYGPAIAAQLARVGRAANEWATRRQWRRAGFRVLDTAQPARVTYQRGEYVRSYALVNRMDVQPA